MKILTLIVGCLLICSCRFHAVAQQASANWQRLTTGEELAHGKKVLFFPKPNYGLTNDKNDPYDLTDGTLSTRPDSRLWLDKNAVGWFGSGISSVNGILLVMDLGSEQPVGQIAIRVLGGKEQAMLKLPSAIEFLASADGKQYYSLQKLTQSDPDSKSTFDAENSYSIPETGKAFVAAFACRQAVQARYIAIRVMPRDNLFTDQISVLKATSSTPLQQLESFPKTSTYPDEIFFDGLAITPRHLPFTVTTNITTPNWLSVQDNSGLDLFHNKAQFKIELPHGLGILPQSQPAFEKTGADTYLFNYDGTTGHGSIGPLWIQPEKDVAIPVNAQIVLTSILNGKDSHRLSYPIHFVKIPEVSPIKGLDISLAWLHDKTEQGWPNFLRDFRKMGFGYVSTFPRAFGKDATGFASNNGMYNTSAQKSLDFLRQAREQGYGIVYDESPFHIMWYDIQSDQRAGKIDDAEAQEIYNQVDGKRGKYMNILYRGKYFQNEIQRVASLAALVQPDQVYLDIELWRASVRESKKDPRVVAAWKKSGKTWEDFATDIGTDVLGTLVKAMREAVPARKLTVGLYDADPQHAIFTDFFEWKKIYPEIIDIAQPSLYVQGNVLTVADRIRFDYDAMQRRQIIPWLSTGTHGEYDPKLTEPIVLETILNGARGLTYFQFTDFDPMDFYYHSKAIEDLAPYEKLLQSGKPIEYKGDNPALHYTCFANTAEALILVGNYSDSPQTIVNLPLPIHSATKVLLEGKPLAVKNDAVSIEVPPGEFRLIYVGNPQ